MDTQDIQNCWEPVINEKEGVINAFVKEALDALEERLDRTAEGASDEYMIKLEEEEYAKAVKILSDTYAECPYSIIKEEYEEYRTYTREVYFCDTLEPPALELKTTVSKDAVLRSPTKAQKLKPFAIPEGRYAVVISWSPKFKMWLPVLLGGPDFNHLFKGIRIHAGNTAKDTAGCILVGRNQLVGQLLESRKWLYELKKKIVEAKARDEAVWLTIR